MLLGIFTAGLLRQFHSKIPSSPYVNPLVGSLLFAAILVTLLAAAREWKRGAVPGRGVRLGSVTPLLLILLVEKWISLGLYDPVFFLIAPRTLGEAELDAGYRLFAGAGLLLACVLLANFSGPTGRRTWRFARPARWPEAAIGTVFVVGLTYLILGAASRSLGAGFHLHWPPVSRLLWMVLIGQALRSFAEEVYYRGLVMGEVHRISPRLGVANAAARRWIALGASGVLFAMEHFVLGPPWSAPLRQSVFILSLGVLLGILVMLTGNLHFAGAMHAWVNGLVLGAAPRFVDGSGRLALPDTTYVGVGLALAFGLAFFVSRRSSHPPGRSGQSRAAGASSGRG